MWAGVHAERSVIRVVRVGAIFEKKHNATAPGTSARTSEIRSEIGLLVEELKEKVKVVAARLKAAKQVYERARRRILVEQLQEAHARSQW